MGRNKKQKRRTKKQKKRIAQSRHQQLSHKIRTKIKAIPKSPQQIKQFTKSKLENFLISSLIFLIPSNLALHFFESQSHIQGVKVDYLIPKLYLTDLVVIALFTVWLYRHRNKLIPKIKSVSQPPILYTLYSILLVTSSFLSPRPIAAFYTLFTYFKLFLLYLYLKSNLKTNNITKPLSLAIIFQSLIAIIQWIQQKSIIGYLFLGETTLKAAGNIAKTSFRGQVKYLPYGTTAHPNVLAGFIAISLIILLILKGRSLKGTSFYKYSILYTLYSILPLTALLLTQSLTAISALVIGLTLFILTPLIKKLSPLSIRTITIIIISLAITSALILYPNFQDHPSIDRRVQLTQISLKIIQAHPILGTGPGNFTALMPNYGEISGTTTRFLQPVHNIYLLFISETGLITTALLLYLIWQSAKKFRISNFEFRIPFILLLFIGLFDHYPFTLQTGQLLLIFTLILPAITKPDQSK